MAAIPVSVSSSFEPSIALQMHIEHRLERALRPYADRVARVQVRLSDANGPKRGAEDKVTRMVVALAPSGRFVVGAAADDFYVSVTRAIGRARAALSRRVERDKQPIAPERSTDRPHDR